jgi:hypothetical protein
MTGHSFPIKITPCQVLGGWTYNRNTGEFIADENCGEVIEQCEHYDDGCIHERCVK